MKNQPGKHFLYRICLIIALLLPGIAYAQDTTTKVEGVVTDKLGEPVIGASVASKGTTIGVMTDLDGKYSIVVDRNATLAFSLVGMKTQEIQVAGKTTINVVMEEVAQNLDEVIVVGYGSQKRGDITTAVSTVSTKDIAERPLVSTAAAMQGKAAGVQISQPNGLPGQGMRIRIRGNTSINASSDPLYVVDGVPMNEVNYLSPNDIESMSILKDASSAAIYGSRAANGVVLITTKRPNNGQSKIEFNSFVGISKVSKNFKSLNTAQYKELMDEIGLVNLPDGLTDQTDWFKETYRTGVNQNYQLSFSNATDKLKYSISGGYTKEDGVIKAAFYERYNFRVNLENDIRKWLKVSANATYSDYTDNGIISGTGANRAGVVLSVINTPSYAPIWSSEKGEEGWYYYNYYGANITHPVENMSRSEDNENNTNRLIASASALITFAPGLTFKSTVSADRFHNKNTSWLDPVKTAYGRSQYGVASDNRSQGTVLIFDNILNYNKTFNQKHNLDVMAGTSGTMSKWSQSYQTVSHFGPWGIKTLNAGNKVEQGNGTTASNWKIMSYLGRLSYNYESKYLATVNFRADGSSKLSPGNRWGYFPSVSLGWRISSEDFLKNVEWLDDMKLRAGWGQVGNQAGISDYASYMSYNIVRQDWWKEGQANALPAISLATDLFNPDLTWETTTQTNAGIDLTVLNSRLSFSADVYYKKTTDLLLYNTIPSGSSYYSRQLRNSGEMVNKGLEFTINSVNTTGKFAWDTQFNISFNKNKFTHAGFTKITGLAQVSEITNENVVRMEEGKPLGMFWGYISDGVNPETGDMMYRDLDNNGRITASDKTYIGDPNPDFTFGMTNNFSYKDFNLNILITGSYGNDIFNASRMETEGMYNGNNQSTVVLDRWKRPGMITDVPRAVNGTDNLLSSTRWIEDGSFIRLKSVSLSYNFRLPALKKLGINKLQVYATANNLLTLTKYSGFDPEVNQYGNSSQMLGIDWGTYPQSKSFVGGINIEF